MQDLNYEQLVNDAIGGSESAFRMLYDVSSGKAYYAALCITKNEKEAVNIMQSSYSTMCERLPRLKYPQMFENWFYRIVCSCIYEYAASVSTSLFDSFNLLAASDFDDELYGEYIGERDTERAQSDRAIVTRILDHLPLDRRLCFLMYYYFKMNIAEISKITHSDEMIVAHFLDEAKKIVKANINNTLVSQNRVLNCSSIVFYASVLSNCTSHVPFKATDMILGNIFNTQKQQVQTKPQENRTRLLTVSDNDSTQMYSGEEIEELIKNSRSPNAGAYGGESSKGGDGDDGIPAGESVAKIVKIAIAVIVGIIFIVAVTALLKNVITNRDDPTVTEAEQTTSVVETYATERETVATTAKTTQAPTTTEAPTTEAPTQAPATTEAPAPTEPELPVEPEEPSDMIQAEE